MRGELEQARRLTDDHFALLAPEALYDRPIPDRHRLIFYLGHLEAFDWNLIARHALGAPSFQPAFDSLFAFGIDPEPGRAPHDSPADWPERAQVEDYNARVRESLDPLIAHAPEELLHTAIEHRLMHAETLAYLFHNLPFERKRGQPAEVPSGSPPRPEWVAIPAGWATLGRTEGFGWDNEFDEHRVFVPAFRIQNHKVTNGEYQEFVRAGGPRPHYWEGPDRLRLMFASVPLPLDHPVYVTQRQAQAYAEWRGLSLPTEAQWHRAAETAPGTGNCDFRSWDTGPEAGDFSPLTGNGWEWTATQFAPFPGFQPRPYYPGYSADFFDGAHYVLKGASPRTAARFLRPSFRNWFRPDYPYVYAGFRCVEHRG